MLWVCFAAFRTGSLIQAHGVFKKKTNCADTLRDNLKNSALSLVLGHRWVLQQDNDPKLERAALRPDFNPTENLWKVLKVNVRAQKIHNLDQLEQFAMED